MRGRSEADILKAQERPSIRINVAKHLPVLRRQIAEKGYHDIRRCLVLGGRYTKFLSNKDRRQALQILDAENKRR